MTRLAGLAAALLLSTAAVAPAQETTAPIVEIRVHGNHSTPEAEILALSGLAVGQPASDAVLDAARARVEASGRFASVTVRRLERSLDVPNDFMALIDVVERAGVSPDNLMPGWASRVASGSMFVPVLRYDEGYGATYGLRTALDGAFGGTSQLAVPATWGGERRIGLEGSRTFTSPLITRVEAGLALTRTIHPAFDLVEERTRVVGRVERAVTSGARIGLEGGRDRVRFGGASDDVHRVSADLLVDTRLDPAFPRNAVWGRAAIERLDVVTGVRRRVRADASAALGLPLNAALTARGFITSADGALPRYEQAMIGGGLSTRGYRRGYRAGDNAAGWSLTLARPFGSPLDIARHGLRAFVDWGAVYDAGTKVGDAAFDRGAGVGWSANLLAVNAYVDVGRGNGQWRVHVRFGTGF